MTSGAMRDRQRNPYADESCCRPQPLLLWQPLSAWRQMLPPWKPAHSGRPRPQTSGWDRCCTNWTVASTSRWRWPRTARCAGSRRWAFSATRSTGRHGRIQRHAARRVPGATADEGVRRRLPVASLDWLSPLLGGLPAVRVVEMLLPEDRHPALRQWLVGLVAPMLRRDDRFRRLRRELRNALWFDPDLFRLASAPAGTAGRRGCAART